MMNARDSSSSSSDDENTHRFKEAVWSFGPATHNTQGDGGKHTHTHSNRLKVCDHEHDGNQLKTTPEFRSHVAKKLGAMLDSVICEVFRESPVCNSAPCEHTHSEADDGFRLFSTSLPGNWREEPEEAPPPKRKPATSSSDSDSEMELRLREAAVSVSDLFPSSSTEGQQERERENDGAGDEESSVPQKKKKRKKKKRKAVSEREEDEDESVNLEDEAVEEHSDTPKRKEKNIRRKTDNG